MKAQNRLLFFVCACAIVACSPKQFKDWTPAIKAALEKLAEEEKPEATPTPIVVAQVTPTATPMPTATPTVVPTAEAEQTTEHVSAETQKAQSPGNCDLIKFDGQKPRFLVLRSNTDKRNIKLITPGLYTGKPEPVNFFWDNGKKEEVKPCAQFLANPDWEKNGKFLRGHYCYRGPKMPDAVQVGQCPAIRLGNKCKKAGRCD